MGRASVKANKSLYQQCREACGMTRAQASEAMVFLSESRLEKIESEKLQPQPEDVLAMASAYGRPELCNAYCTQKCAIGKRYVPEVRSQELSKIVLETLVALNGLSREKDRLMEITVDDAITADELKDFARIQKLLRGLAANVSALQFWVESRIAVGAIDPGALAQEEEDGL